MKPDASKRKSTWKWVPSLYYAEGIPYVVVMLVSVIMYKRLGISNTDIALYTSWLYLPWVIKPLWSPVVDLLKTKRFWIISMQLIIGAGLACVALTLPFDNFFKYSLAFLWLMAFSSATHDIAADGFYLLALDEHEQSWFVGIRSSFYRLAMISGQGLLVLLAGTLEANTGLNSLQIDVLAQQAKQTYTITETSPEPLYQFDKNATTLELVSDLSAVNISTNDYPADAAAQMKNYWKTYNTEAGFYGQQATAKAQTQKEHPETIQEETPSALENFLRKHFGKESATSGDQQAGDIGMVFIHLNNPDLLASEDEIVVNINRNDGDPSINLVEGQRIVFNQANKDKAAAVLFQLDHRLKTDSQAQFKVTSGNIRLAWTVTFGIMAVLFILFFVYHFFVLPKPTVDVANSSGQNFITEYFRTFGLFFKKEKIGWILAFLLMYRFGEAQLAKMATPFLLDSTAAGGLGMSTGEVGFIYGTLGVAALTVGGILGGLAAAKHGLKRWLWPMLIAINAPNLVYIFLSYTQPEASWVVAVSVVIEQFGYGFGFTAYMLYCIFASKGKHKTAHFALTTGFMALGMMIPGMFSGWLQDIIGYQHFFIWVIIATVPAFIISAKIPLDPNFGKKTEEAS